MDTTALAYAGLTPRRLLAGLGVVAVLTLAWIFVVDSNREPTAPPGPAPHPTPTPRVETDCAKLYPPCSNEADADGYALPGMEDISGFAKVLSASVLEIKDKHIELAYIERAPADSAKKLKDFIGWYGPSVRCRPAPIRGKYLCDVGQAHKDLTTQVLHEHWAKPTADAPPELSRK